MHLAGYPLAALADKVGTPFYLYDAQILHERLGKVAALTQGPALKARYTAGPSSKHGLWLDDLARIRALAADAKLPIVALHAHIGTGPQIREFDENMRKLVSLFVELVPSFPDLQAVNLGGGIPHPYRPGAKEYDLAWYRPVLVEAAERLAKAARRPISVEIEPGRYPVAAM